MLQNKQEGMSDEAMHKKDDRDTQGEIATKYDKMTQTDQNLKQCTCDWWTDSTGSSWWKSLCGSCSCCCIFLLQLEVLLFTWSEDFSDKKTDKCSKNLIFNI